MKVQLNELRVGNIVRNPKSNGAESISVSVLSHIAVHEEHPFEAVPITEDWLLKFGFGKSNEHELGRRIANSSFWCYYDYHFDSFYLDCTDVATTQDCMVFLNHVKYVHQLQNIVFALTGEELI